MKISKDAVKKLIGMSSTRVDAIRVSPHELPTDQKLKLKQLNQQIEKRLRTSKDITIAIIEWPIRCLIKITTGDVMNDNTTLKEMLLDEINKEKEMDELLRCSGFDAETQDHVRRRTHWMHNQHQMLTDLENA